MCFQRGKPDHPSEKTSPPTVDTVFFPTPIHTSKQRPKNQKQKLENVQNYKFHSQKE